MYALPMSKIFPIGSNYLLSVIHCYFGHQLFDSFIFTSVVDMLSLAL